MMEQKNQPSNPTPWAYNFTNFYLLFEMFQKKIISWLQEKVLKRGISGANIESF